MNPVRSLARAVALASCLSAASLTAHAAELPIADKTLEGHISTQVLNVDAANHRVTVEGANQQPVTFQLTENAKNLGNLKAGDKVEIDVSRSVAYVLNTEVGGAPKVSDEAGTLRAAPGSMPAGDAFRQVKVTSQIKKIDLATHEVTLLPPDGPVRVVKVEHPELQARMKDLKEGQTVTMIFTEVLSVRTSQ